MELTRASPQAAKDAAERVANVKKDRDNVKAREALASLSAAAKGKENLQPLIRAAVRSYCTVGEIAGALKKEFGTYEPPTRF
jgi:methylmalonyl-CoA mutase N-terminal domain/subunit